MGLIVLGLIVLLVGIFAGKGNSNFQKFKGLIVIGGIVVIAIGFVTSAIRIIPPGHVGVQILLGKVQNRYLTEGLQVVNPLVQMEEFSIRTQNYTMSSTSEEGQNLGDDAIRLLSKDGLEVNIDLTILYRVKPKSAPDIYRRIGLDYEDIIIRPITRTGIRSSAAEYNAIELFAEKRREFEKSIRVSIEDTMQMRGFAVDQILIRKIDLPASVKQSIENKIKAIQEAQRMKYVLQKEEKEAERRRVEAQGIADAQEILNTGLTPKVLEWEWIKMQKELATSENSKVIIMGESKNSPPLFFNK